MGYTCEKDGARFPALQRGKKKGKKLGERKFSRVLACKCFQKRIRNEDRQLWRVRIQYLHLARQPPWDKISRRVNVAGESVCRSLCRYLGRKFSVIKSQNRAPNSFLAVEKHWHAAAQKYNSCSALLLLSPTNSLVGRGVKCAKINKRS